MSDLPVQPGVVVALSYTLTDADSGEQLERRNPSSPAVMLMREGVFPPGLEAAITALAEGDDFDVTIEPAEAFGERTGTGPVVVKRSEFPRDMKLHDHMPFRAESSDGKEVVMWVVKVAGSRVYVDHEHPLVGRRVRYVGRVERVREPTASELAHGHAHGIDGDTAHA